jgi:hypothetical protein
MPETTSRATGAEISTMRSLSFHSPFLLLQGVYYLLTGIWSFVGIRSFQLVTGPKTDLWLVKTVGVLVTVIGGVLIFAARRPRLVPEIPLLGIGSALGLTAIDVIYVARGRISPVYLLDALLELFLAAGLLLTWTRASDPQ